MEVYRVNIDFELQLESGVSKRLRPQWSREWEYLFWWVEDSERLLENNNLEFYEPSDLNYIKLQTKRDHLFSPSPVSSQGQEGQVINWWGRLDGGKTITKLDLPDIRQNALFDYSSYILPFGSIPRSFPCIVKKTYSFSGKGVYLLKTKDQFVKQFKSTRAYQLLIEPFHRIKDHFGYYIFSNKRQAFYQTFSVNKEYRGCLFDREYLNQDSYKFFSEKLEMSTRYIFDKYKVIGNYGIDCYTHEQGAQAICEVNHRKTLASVCFDIFDQYFSEFRYGRSFIFKAPRLSQEEIQSRSVILQKKIDQLTDQSKDLKILRLSPLNGQFFFHFFIGTNCLGRLHITRKMIEDSFYLS